MDNIKPISNTEILIARIKGLFPFFLPLTYTQIVLGELFYFGFISTWIAFIPYGLILFYYMCYFGFVLGANFLIWLAWQSK